MRGRLVDRLQKDGFALAGGDARPMTQAEAEQLAGRLTDSQVYGAVYSSGACEKIGVGEGGGFLDFIRRIVTWFGEHPEVVEMILKILMSLLMFL